MTDSEALVACIEEQVVPRLYGAPMRVERLERSLSPSTTSYTADVLTVQFTGARTVRLFVKDFAVTRLPKDDAARRRDRELYVYRDLLDPVALGTPAFYGSIWDEEEGRHVLVLELVEGVQLRDCRFEQWVLAAEWLGRLQGRYVREAARLKRWPWLLRHDERYFASKATDAVWNVKAVAPAAAPRLQGLLDGYDDLVALMAAEQSTLVHGNFRPKNIIVADGVPRPRICVVDWEVSAFGSTLYDLALLADGFRGRQLDRLVDTYRSEAEANGVPVPDRETVLRLLDCFCLHRVVKSLSRAVEKGFGHDDVSRLLDHGERLCTRLQ